MAISYEPDPDQKRRENGRAPDDVFYTKSSQASLPTQDSTSQSGAGISVDTVATAASNRRLVYGEDENKERGNWTGRFDFLLSLLGYAVGLGNIWRFPYLCYRNGGGAFLLPFLLMMGIIGIPLFFMEASLGQFCSSGPMACWQFAPLFKGLGVAMVLTSFFTALYYNMILAWAQYYLFASFTATLPWQTCDNPWNSRDCSLNLPLTDCLYGKKFPNGTCYRGQDFMGLYNTTLFKNVTGRVRILPSDEYWNKKALALAPSWDEFGTPKWEMVLNLLLAWIICFFCLLKGIKTTGKVVYFTAIFPYVVLLILFFRGVTLPNAGAGIRYFIVPQFERLLDARVWKDAANQIFFSMSIAGGGLITLSSYNRFHNNILRDSLLVAFGDAGTCVFGGFVIFSYLGYMAGEMKVDVSEVAQDGAGLAFVVYPAAVSSLPPPTLWSILFFFMLITLGLDSQFAMLETVLTGVLDTYPGLRPKKTLVIAAICIVLFLLGLPLTCPGGMYLLQLLDSYVGGWTLIVIGFFEIIAIVAVYGAERFYRDIEIMLGNRPNIFWKICWYGLSPACILGIFIFTFVDYSPSTYGDYQYPAWADAVGWVVAVGVIMPIFIGMLYKVIKDESGDSVLERVKFLCTPTKRWGPALPQHRRLVDYVDDFEVHPDSDIRPEPSGAYLNRAFTSSSIPNVSLGASRMTLGSEAGRSYYSTNTGVTMASFHSQASFESTV